MKNILLIISCLTILSCQNKKATHTESTKSDSTTIVPETDSLPKAASIEKTNFKDSLTYKTVYYHKETKKVAIKNDSNNYGYVKAYYPVFSARHRFLNDQVINIITAAPWTGETASSMEKASEKFLKEYLDFKKDVPDSPAGYSWDQNLKVSYQDANLVVLTSDSYIYTAGAHGLESLLYFNFDVKEKKKLALKDLFIANYSKKLTEIAEQIFRKNEGLTADEPLDNYFFENKTFNLNNNFAITPKGLLFTYNPYEIKSYAEGRTNLLVPYSSITSLIKPNSFISKYVNK